MENLNYLVSCNFENIFTQSTSLKKRQTNHKNDHNPKKQERHKNINKGKTDTGLSVLLIF